MTHSIKQKLGTNKNYGYTLLQKLTDNTHFHKKIYLSYRDADRYGVSETKLSSKNIQYKFYEVNAAYCFDDGTTFYAKL